MEEKILTLISQLEAEAGRCDSIKKALLPQQENLPLKYTAADMAEKTFEVWNTALKMVRSALAGDRRMDDIPDTAETEAPPVSTVDYFMTLKDEYEGMWTGKLTVPEHVTMEEVVAVMEEGMSGYRTTYNGRYKAKLVAGDLGWALEEVEADADATEHRNTLEIALQPSPVFVKHTEEEYEQMIDEIIKPLPEGAEKLNDNPKRKKHILSHWNEYNLVDSAEEMLKLLNILEAHDETLESLHDISMGNTRWLCEIYFDKAPTDREIKDTLFMYHSFYKNKEELVRSYVFDAAEDDELFEEYIRYETILESSDGFIRVFEC